MIHNVIGGRSVPAAAGGQRELIDPATGAVHAVATESRAADVDAAVASAREAFGSWRHTTPAERSALLLRAAEAHAGELVIVGVPAAIANAVFNATGRRVTDLPITLEKLL